MINLVDLWWAIEELKPILIKFKPSSTLSSLWPSRIPKSSPEWWQLSFSFSWSPDQAWRPYLSSMLRKGTRPQGKVQEEEKKLAFENWRNILKTHPLSWRMRWDLFVYSRVAFHVEYITSQRRNKVQKSVYFISHTLSAAKTSYPLIEKCALKVVAATRKLRPYFEAHPITVLAYMPLGKALRKVNKSRRFAKWVNELSTFGIKYNPWTTIKGQALADLIAKC